MSDTELRDATSQMLEEAYTKGELTNIKSSIDALVAGGMDEDTDMAYGRMKHTWFQKQAFNDSQGDDDDNNDNSADDKKVIYDFNEPYANMLEKYRKLDKITVLSAIYKKSLFTDNNIRFNEKQTYFSDTKVLVQLLNNAKNIKSNEESVYVKRHHNDKAKNPAISQFTREETMPDYFVAYKNAIKAAGTNERIIRERLWQQAFIQRLLLYQQS